MKVWKPVIAAALAVLAFGTARADTQTIQVWHALGPAHRAVFESFVSRFNREQSAVKVELAHAPTFETLQSGLSQALAKKQPPHFVQLPDNHAPEAVARQNQILPLHELLAKYPVKDLKWFLPQTTSFVRDGRGRVLALPLMAEVPVLFYNRDLYAKAGLDPNAPPTTWRDLQKHLLALREIGVQCPYATSRMAWVHQENLAAVNNKPFATRNNGLEGGNAQLLVQDMLHIRHMALMTSWARSKLFVQATVDDTADQAFARGECAVLSSGTGAWASLENAGFATGVAPLPIYTEATKAAGSPLVGGSSLWATTGHPAPEQKAMASFVAWMASPAIAAEWHQRTGFLPLTDAAARAADVSFYGKIPGSQRVIQSMQQAPGQHSRGVRLAQYPAVVQILNEETWAALTGVKPPMQAQNDAVQRAAVALKGS